MPPSNDLLLVQPAFWVRFPACVKGGQTSIYTGMDKTSLNTSSSTLFVRDGGCPRHVELRNYVPLFSVTQSNVDLRNYVPLFGVTQPNVDLRNYVISRQIVI